MRKEELNMNEVMEVVNQMNLEKDAEIMEQYREVKGNVEKTVVSAYMPEGYTKVLTKYDFDNLEDFERYLEDGLKEYDGKYIDLEDIEMNFLNGETVDLVEGKLPEYIEETANNLLDRYNSNELGNINPEVITEFCKGIVALHNDTEYENVVYKSLKKEFDYDYKVLDVNEYIEKMFVNENLNNLKYVYELHVVDKELTENDEELKNNLTVDTLRYVGSTKDFRTRVRNHMTNLYGRDSKSAHSKYKLYKGLKKELKDENKILVATVAFVVKEDINQEINNHITSTEIEKELIKVVSKTKKVKLYNTDFNDKFKKKIRKFSDEDVKDDSIFLVYDVSNNNVSTETFDTIKDNLRENNIEITKKVFARYLKDNKLFQGNYIFLDTKMDAVTLYEKGNTRTKKLLDKNLEKIKDIKNKAIKNTYTYEVTITKPDEIETITYNSKKEVINEIEYTISLLDEVEIVNEEELKRFKNYKLEKGDVIVFIVAGLDFNKDEIGVQYKVTIK